MQARFRAMTSGEPALKRQRLDDDVAGVASLRNAPKRAVAPAAVVAPRIPSPRPGFARQIRRNEQVLATPMHGVQSPEVGNGIQRGRTDDRSLAHTNRYNYSRNQFSPTRRDRSRSIVRPFASHSRNYSPYDNRRHDSVSSARSRPYSPPRNWPARRVPYSPPRRNSISTDISAVGPIHGIGAETDNSIASTCVSPNQGPIFTPPASIPGLSLARPKSPVHPASPSPLTADSGIALPSIICSNIPSHSSVERKRS